MKRFRHWFVEGFFASAALASGLLTLGVLLFMLGVGWPSFQDGQLLRLLTEEWQPRQGQYGIRPMLYTSLTLSMLSLIISLPLSLGVSFLATCIAPPSVRLFLMRLVGFMAGIPTVIYGFVALFLLVPFMRELLESGSGMNILTASLVLALVIAPTMIVFFVAAIKGVSPIYLTAVAALGGNQVQKLLYVVLPQAWPGLFAGLLMGLGRAMGDTLISLMIAGNAAASPSSLLDSARTLTAHIALVMAADFAGMEFRSIYACGIFLYLFTALIVSVLRIFTLLCTRKP